MREAKLTPWFPGDVKPVRRGVYQRLYTSGTGWAYWNGDFWGMRGVSKYFAKSMKDFYAPIQSHEWRGLAEDPKK